MSRMNHCPLTPNQVQALTLAAQGLVTKEIARAMGLSMSVANHHLEHSIDALGAINRVNAVAIALVQGWIRLSYEP